ncbi:MAG: glycosyltransferase family 9 protein [Tannerella sp.]|jgi:ADP-heptose:LPS heptosyltransferase|nr:glycosyltransferase family 9 protein [Tannerella sp.]
MSEVLIIRLSAIGDVAMTVPVVYSAAKAYPQHSFTVLTQSFLEPVFINRPPNLKVAGLNTKAKEKSLFGLIRFAFQLRKRRFDVVLDLHNVIRSRIVDFVFRMMLKKVFIIDKRRKERREITARPPKSLRRLCRVTDRYAEVFHKAGFVFEMSFVSLFGDSSGVPVADVKPGRRIGIAPFAKHRGKIFPLEKMEKVVGILSGQKDVTIFLFGGRGDEEAVLSKWAERYDNVISVAGRYALDRELELMNRLDVLVSMDSANMHLASLVDTKVVSIWGATHPYTGFYGYRQREDRAVQTDLPCRPCSVYGNKPCYRGDRACLNAISPEQVVAKINDCTDELPL